MRKRSKYRPNKIKPMAPVLVTRGIRNDELEMNERMAIQALIEGWATPEHFTIVADMHGVMLLAASTDKSRAAAWEYAHKVVGPALQKIAERYTQRKALSVTTGERAVLREFTTKYREFWLRQPTELYELASMALKEHYQQLAAEAAQKQAQEAA